ncbi:hypothetical protein LIER_13824 [Lithospermum erythrorhizon]|uniref:Reverse transcriptase domain-containing protein n=1 Tax=Lithospermum erythrorhizon TaxID=34254 RepID=A0AAV3PZ22_LITER
MPQNKKDMSKFCQYHKDHGHDTDDCRHLKIEKLIQRGGQERGRRLWERQTSVCEDEYLCRDGRRTPRVPKLILLPEGFRKDIIPS